MVFPLDFDEDTERRHLAKLIELLMERAFGQSTEFDHGCMSAGEALGRCLSHLKVAHFDGHLVKLEMPNTWIINKVQSAELSELPALIDVLDVLLSFEGQHGNTPRDYEVGQKARFDLDVTKILCDLGLLNRHSRPSDLFLLMMINHYFLVPKDGVWNDELGLLLTSLAKETWNFAPSEYKNVLLGNSNHPLRWAEGYLEERWRYGNWLSERRLKRALDQSHLALPWMINRSIAKEHSRVGRQ